MSIDLRIIFAFALAAFCFGCGPQSQTQKDLKNINRVISGIEARQEMESRVIHNEQKAINLLKENYKKVNSDGMREKISREITMKESVIEKSKKNKVNQELILDQLYSKRDSILKIEIHSN